MRKRRHITALLLATMVLSEGALAAHGVYEAAEVFAYTTYCDADGDGMPDDGEARYELDPNNADDADQDADSDRHSNLEEYIAGTSPTNSADCLEITQMSIAEMTNVILNWDSVAERLYAIQTTSNLLSSWTNVSDPIYTNMPGTGLPLSYTNTIREDILRYFRLKVRLE